MFFISLIAVGLEEAGDHLNRHSWKLLLGTVHGSVQSVVQYSPWFSTVRGSVLAKAQSAWLILQREIMHSR